MKRNLVRDRDIAINVLNGSTAGPIADRCNIGVCRVIQITHLYCMRNNRKAYDDARKLTNRKVRGKLFETVPINYLRENKDTFMRINL